MKVEAFYDKLSEEYDSYRHSGYFVFMHQMETDIVKRVSEGKDVLEIGCGTGLIMQEIKGNVRSIVGVDLSASMVHKALDKGLTVKKADAQALPFQDSCFDTVYSFKVFPHVPDIRKALQEASRVTKKGGRVIIEFYCPYSVKRVTAELSGRFKDVATRYDTLNDVKSALPKELSVEDAIGIRIITPAAFFLSVPIVSHVLAALERFLSKTCLKCFASNLVVVCRKTGN